MVQTKTKLNDYKIEQQLFTLFAFTALSRNLALHIKNQLKNNIIMITFFPNNNILTTQKLHI
ncbi:MAG: hypothetical protein FWH37_02485 [Candidatus Bathyarchaeota archaeon]|nr:hypothetical protein [Candidatus Termiticorpusculum sp.]